MVTKNNLRNLAVIACKFGLSAILLYLAVHKLSAASILERMRNVDSHYFIPLLVLAPTTVFLLAWRWKILSFGLLGYSSALRYTWIGLFYGGILPGIVGGDVAKGISLAVRNPGARDSRLPVSIIVDKIVGLWALLLLFEFVCLVLLYTDPRLLLGLHAVIWTMLVLCTVGICVGIAICQRSSILRLQKFTDSVPKVKNGAVARWLLSVLMPFENRGFLLVRAASIASLLHIINALVYWFAMHSLGIPANLYFAAFFYFILSILLSLPISISGIGIRDVFSARVLSLAGYSAAIGIALSWLLLGLSLISVCIGALLQISELFRSRRSPD